MANLLTRIIRKVRESSRLPFNLEPHDQRTWPQGEILFQADVSNPLKQWMCHPKYQDLAELTCSEGVMKFHISAKSKDEWGYIFLDPREYMWRDYSWQTRFRRMTSFQEYAFNFRYVDFDNRYRYRFEDNLLFFDSKIKGTWRAHARMPFPMALAAWYDLRIDTKGECHRCYVNDILMMENHERSIQTGSICIILWEVDQATDAIAEIGPCTVRSLR